MNFVMNLVQIERSSLLFFFLPFFSDFYSLLSFLRCAVIGCWVCARFRAERRPCATLRHHSHWRWQVLISFFVLFWFFDVWHSTLAYALNALHVVVQQHRDIAPDTFDVDLLSRIARQVTFFSKIKYLFCNQ